MNRVFKLLTFSVALASTMFFSSCNKEKGKNIATVGVASYFLLGTSEEPNSYYNLVTQKIMDDLGTKDFLYYVGDGAIEEDLQVKQMQAFLDEGCEVLSFFPIERDGFDEVLGNIRAKGAYSIAVNSPIARMSLVDAYVGSDNKEAGRMVATNLASLRPGGGTIIVVKGTSCADDLRAEGFREEIANLPIGANSNVVILDAKGVREDDGIDIMESVIGGSGMSKLICVFGTTDELALGADAVLREQGTTGYELYGVDGTDKAFEAIVDRKMTASVGHDYKAIGAKVAEVNYDMVKKLNYDKENLIEPTLFKRSDLIE